MLQFIANNTNKLILVGLIMVFGWRLRDASVLQHFTDMLIGALLTVIVPKIANPLDPKV